MFFFNVKESLKKIHDTWNYVAIISLIGLTLYQGIFYFNYYYLPNTDFIMDVEPDTKLVQEILFHQKDLIENIGKLSYKRLPFFLLILSITEPVIKTIVNVRFPLLFTIQLINLFLSISAIGLIYVFSSKILGKFGFLVPLLILFNRNFVYITAHPTFDLLLINMVFLTLYLNLKNSKISYFTAFLATMTKPEGILIVPSIIIKDLIFSNKKMFVLLIGIVISLPLLTWMFLSYSFIGHYPLLTEMISHRGRRFEFFFNTISETINTFCLERIAHEYLYNKMPLFLFESVVLILFFIGTYSLIKNRKEILPSVIFLSIYTLAHSIHPHTGWRYIIAILPIVIIFIIQGFKLVVKEFYRKWKIHEISKSEPVYLLIFVFSVLLIVLYNKSVVVRISNINFLYFYFIGTTICFLVYVTKNISLWKRLIVISIGLVFLSFIISENLIYTKNFIDNDKYFQAEFRVLGEWCSYNLNYGDTLVTPHARFVIYFCENYSRFNIISSENIECNSQECFVSKLRVLDMENGENKTYLAIPSHIFEDKTSELYFNWGWYLLDNITITYKKNFKLTKDVIIGPKTLSIYEFIN